MTLKHDGYFVGAIPPSKFLEDFMTFTETRHERIPRADFSKVPLKTSVPDMCIELVCGSLNSSGAICSLIRRISFEPLTRVNFVPAYDCSEHGRRINGFVKLTKLKARRRHQSVSINMVSGRPSLYERARAQGKG